MTVESSGTETYSNREIVHCVWFEGTKKLSGNFVPETLQLIAE
jgi:uncharacterized protein YodC (DUF2158 family)